MDDVVFGFVYDFGANEEWTAVRGGGAFLNGKPLTGGRRTCIEFLSIEATRGDARPRPAARRSRRSPTASGSWARRRSPSATSRPAAPTRGRRCRPSRSVDFAAAQLLVRERGFAIAMPDGAELGRASARPRLALARRRGPDARALREARRQRCSRPRLGRCARSRQPDWTHARRLRGAATRAACRSLVLSGTPGRACSSRRTPATRRSAGSGSSPTTARATAARRHDGPRRRHLRRGRRSGLRRASARPVLRLGHLGRRAARARDGGAPAGSRRRCRGARTGCAVRRGRARLLRRDGRAEHRGVRRSLESDEAPIEHLERDRAELLARSPEELVEAWHDAARTGRPRVRSPAALAELRPASMRAGIEPSLDGWFDDDCAFTLPWGFELGSIRVPVLLLAGRAGPVRAVRPRRLALASTSPVSSRASPPRTATSRSSTAVPEVHAWLARALRATLNPMAPTHEALHGALARDRPRAAQARDRARHGARDRRSTAAPCRSRSRSRSPAARSATRFQEQVAREVGAVAGRRRRCGSSST